MAKSSNKYLAKSSFDDLLMAATPYNSSHNWGKIAYVLSHFVNDVLTEYRFTVYHQTKDGTTMYSHPLAELTPELSWELILRAMSLYSIRDTLPMTKDIMACLKYFLKIPTYEDAETCVRIANYIMSCTAKSAKAAGLPLYRKKYIHKPVEKKPTVTITIEISFGAKFDAVSKFITEKFPLSAKAVNIALSPGYVLTPETRPVSKAELRALSREVHPDKMVDPTIPEKVKKVAEIAIVILNQLREDTLPKMPYSVDDVYKIINP
jgi:hypothetical protein